MNDDERRLVIAARQAACRSETRYWHRKPACSRCAEQIALAAALVHFGDAIQFDDVRMIAVVAGSRASS